jgi:DNA-binding transcriptional regulator YiaG
MKKKTQPKARPRVLMCDCGGELKPAALENYDFSGYCGFSVLLKGVPGLKCSKCSGETIDGGIINALLKIMVVEVTKVESRLPADEAKFLRRILGATQQELANRMGIARETVAKWECGEQPISPQHDLILRVIVLTPLLAKDRHLIPPNHLADLLTRLQAVRTEPPRPLPEINLENYNLRKRAREWKASGELAAASA